MPPPLYIKPKNIIPMLSTSKSLRLLLGLLPLILVGGLIIAFTLHPAAVRIEATRIDYDYRSLLKITDSPDIGELTPFSSHQSIFIAGNAKIGIVNHATGKITRWFEEQQLREGLKHIIDETYASGYEMIEEHEYWQMPFCQRHAFSYNHAAKIPGTNDIGCYVDIVVKAPDENQDFGFLKALMVLDTNLALKELIEIEWPTLSGGLHPQVGFFCTDVNNFWVMGSHSAPSEIALRFVHFTREGNRYLPKGVPEGVPSVAPGIYVMGRFFSSIHLDGIDYVNNGKGLWPLARTGQKNRPMSFNLSKHEIVANLVSIKEHILIGVKPSMDEEGAARTSTLFTCTSTFSNFRDIKIYDHLKFRMCSMRSHEGVSYQLLFDRDREFFLIEKVSL